MLGQVRARIDDDVVAGLADDVGVGAWSGHHAGVGCGQTLQIAPQGDRGIMLPVERMQDAAIGCDQFELAIGHLVFAEAGFLALETGAARARGKNLRLGLTGIEHIIDSRKAREHPQGPDRRKDHVEAAGLMTLERGGRAHPDRVELLSAIGNRFLAMRHRRDKKAHIETFGQIAIGDPVREPSGAIKRELGIGLGELPVKVGIDRPIEHGAQMRRAGQVMSLLPCEQHTELLEGLAQCRACELTMRRILIVARADD